ncbi:MAG TPA: hypothetical protein PKJ45_05350 [Rubrivivax sp.]|nr:hypothetical protein [Burkholderiales bacterium]HNU10776.1 hypothetical protein [Rubrivivax sp.]
MDTLAQTENLPSFYAQAPRIRVRDPLAAFLGAASGGVLDYGYDDAVRLAGHSCPTVAGAWLMARAALKALYPDALPERGGVTVEFADAADHGVTGVIARVVSLPTGVAGEEGFKGIGGRFTRCGLLRFSAPVRGEFRVTRSDGGGAVDVSSQIGLVPGDPNMRAAMIGAFDGDPDSLAAFGAMWQDRVRRLLLEHADDPEVIVVRPVRAG